MVDNPPAPPMRPALPTRAATADEVKALAKLAGHAMLAADLEGRIEGIPVDSMELPEFGPGKPVDPNVRGAVSGRDVEGIRPQVEEWLHSYGLDFPAGTADARRTLMTWGTELAKARKAMRQRDEGEPHLHVHSCGFISSAPESVIGRPL